MSKSEKEKNLTSCEMDALIRNEPLKELRSDTDQKEDEENDDEEFVDLSQEKSGIVKVIGYEMTESSSKKGGKHSNPSTPLSRPATPVSRPATPLFLSNPLPPCSQLLVSQEKTQTLPSDDEEPVVLSAKVTLSLIGLPEHKIDESQTEEVCNAKKSSTQRINQSERHLNEKEQIFDSHNKDIAEIKENITSELKKDDNEAVSKDGCLNSTVINQDSVHEHF